MKVKKHEVEGYRKDDMFYCGMTRERFTVMMDTWHSISTCEKRGQTEEVQKHQ
jgi:hypothetical protein